MSFGQYILRGKEPVLVDDTLEWGRWMESGERRVALDEISPEVKVSTVFLGLDHNFGDGPPVFFETMVFGGPLDGEGERYSTWQEAEAGHRAIVDRVRSAL